ncbi:histidine phosphatase family protein [Paludibacterium sp. THUN1379]|uniref:histidine phosphatase family protein n=1 Tax=Paludibacterium sp. THUN1379 TaxID=3112107 RepID=UPI003090FD45|nr:histidine phosphatase family protein [Paludibacterium sp. THUN1379]
MPSALTTRFCLVRHGETDWNIERRLQGQIDIQLNTTGLQQADRLSQALAQAGLAFSALYVSDLQRARQTAAAIARDNALTPIATERLRERHFGHFQGLTYAEAEVRIPEDYRLFKSRDPAYAPGSGESLAVFQSRVQTFFDEAAARHPGQTVLVVSHGGVLDIAYRMANKLPITHQRDFPIPNAALNWISHVDGEWQLERWADQSHLEHSRDEL